MARTLFVGLMALSLICNYCFALPSGVPGHAKFDSCSIEDGVSQGDINGDDHLPEASGLAYSGRTDGVLWSLNDHGGEDRIFAISEQGERLLDLSMEDVKNEDWEDIAVVVEGGVSYIYLSDTGNNDFDNEDARETIIIYKFPEPAIQKEVPDQEISKDNIEKIELTYPDQSYDCEALAVDPATGDILLFTKDREEAISQVFRVPNVSPAPGEVQVLENVGVLPLYWVTGGDISPAGDILALTNKEEAWSFTLPEGLTWVEYLATSPVPCVLNLMEEEQRESIAVTDTGYWTTSECEAGCPLWYYARK